MSIAKLHTQIDKLFIGFLAFAVISFLLAIVLESNLFFLAPFGLLTIYVSILDYRFLYLLLFACIPFSIEFYLPNGLGLDLPTEPIMLLLTGISILLLINRGHEIDVSYLKQPILYLMLIHIIWIFITAITSVNIVISLKFFLAKLWYVIPFYFLSLHLLKENKYIYGLSKVLIFFVVLVLIYTNLRHYGYDFSFDKINRSVSPFFRNHVNYAALIAVTIPFTWAVFLKTKKKLYLAILILMVFSVYFSYTRAAYITVFMLPFLYYIVKFKLLKPGVWIGIIAIPFIVLFFTQKNNYLNYAPDFEKTIMNYDFDDLVAATYKLEDLSTMERVYRWVAGGHMMGEHPYLGFGPATFYSTYKGYVVTDFQTYVSDNPEKSGIHNYFLMTAVEQGVLGFLIFLTLIITSLIIGQNVYNRATDTQDKQLIMATILSLISIIAILIINDMLESDKLGPLFFVNIAILTHYDIKQKKAQKTIPSTK